MLRSEPGERLRAIVTGGGKGIGRATALAFAEAGVDVGILVRGDVAAAEATAEDVRKRGVAAHVVTADIAEPERLRDAVAALGARLGGVDMLVNSAGVSIPRPLAELSVADWDATFAVNTRGTFVASVACLPFLRASVAPSIVNVAAATAHSTYPMRGAYAASKAAVLSLTRQMAAEWGGEGIRVNAVSPGPVRTEANSAMLERPEVKERIARLPLGRPAGADEIAAAILFLALGRCGAVTGQALVVDSGGLLTSYLHP